MNRLPGLSYGHSLAYPHFTRRHTPSWHFDEGALVTVLELVHPGQFKALPPSPWAVIAKAEVMGLGGLKDFAHYH